jgi:hypothetical protein
VDKISITDKGVFPFSLNAKQMVSELNKIARVGYVRVTIIFRTWNLCQVGHLLCEGLAQPWAPLDDHVLSNIVLIWILGTLFVSFTRSPVSRQKSLDRRGSLSRPSSSVIMSSVTCKSITTRNRQMFLGQKPRNIYLWPRKITYIPQGTEEHN